MKKTLSMILVVCMSLSFAGCNEKKKAFELSKGAYEKVSEVFSICDVMGSDIYEAWRLGIYEKNEIIDGGCSYLAGELNLSVDEIRDGATYTIVELSGLDWDSVTDGEKQEYENNVDFYFYFMEDELFSYCVQIVNNAYVVNGDVDKATELLEEAKTQMKEMSDKYSDYEHYPALKGYYTTTNSLFDFCQNPTGSFEQLVTTIDDYRNTARDYEADLKFIFED